MDGKDGLQLLPGTKKRLGVKIPGENRFLYIGSAVLGAVLVAMFSLGRYESSLQDQVKQIDDQLVTLEQKRNKKDEAELKLTKDRLIQTSTLIKGHNHWTLAFSWIENMLQSDIQTQNIFVNQKGELSISARAVNYTAIARQIASFISDNRVLDLGVGKMSTTSDGSVEFSLDMKLDLSKLIKK